MTWPTKKLGEVTVLNPKKSEVRHISDGTEVSFVPMAAIDENTQSIKKIEAKRFAAVRKGYTYFRNGDILFAKITPCMENGKIAIAKNLKNGIGFGSTEFHVIRPTAEVLREWIFYIVTDAKFRMNAESQMTGSAGQQRVPEEFLRGYEIPLPPLDLQRKIVTRIEKSLSKIDEASRLRAEVSTASSALLPSALYHIFNRAEKEGWDIKKVGEICKEPQYGYTASAKQEKVGPKFLRITDIQNGQVDWSSVPHCKCDQVPKYQLKDGDLVFARTGATVGKSFLIESLPVKAVFASYLIRLRAKDFVIPKYLYSFFQSPDYWQQIAGHQVGIAQPNVNASKLSEIKIPVPPPTEQKEIVQYLDRLSAKVRDLQSLQQKTATDFLALRQSILAHELTPGQK